MRKIRKILPGNVFQPLLGAKEYEKGTKGIPKGKGVSLLINPIFSCKFPISKQFLLAGQDELPAVEAVYQS